MQEAAKKYNHLYFTWVGIGDNLCLFTAARNYFEKTGKKILISSSVPELLEGTDYCDYISDNIFVNCAEYEKRLKKLGIKLSFISPTHISWLNETQNVVLWPQQHIAAEYCSKLGINGQVDLNPYVHLTKEEKEFGRFYSKNQIAIMTDGLQKYKTYPFEKIQRIVNELHKKYNFVQIGSKADRLLDNVLDKRGSLSLRQVAAVLNNSNCAVLGIGGLCHLAAAVGCPAVVTYSLGEPLIMVSYPNNITLTSKNGCCLCGNNLRDPQHQVCYNNYSCIRTIKESDVTGAINRMMNDPEQYQQKPFIANVSARKEEGLYHYHAMHRTLWCESAFNNRYSHVFKARVFGIPIVQYIRRENERNLLVGRWSILKLQTEYF